jgi:L-cysteine:1D-myo-inositol 2-amino-2-deoxy-alpha-D-glucopyranoside ligase
MGGEKMSKSLGNLVFGRDLLDSVDPAVVRLALMSYHYRRGGEWQADAIRDAGHLLTAIRAALTRPDGADPRPLLAQLRADLDDDLNAPAALTTLRQATQALLLGGSSTDAGDGLRQMLDLLGLKVEP